MKSNYFQKLKDPRWQKKRLEIFELNNFECSNCGNSELTLHAHHRIYRKNTEPWDYDNIEIDCLCESCHKKAHDKASEIKDLLSQIDSSSGTDIVIGYLKALVLDYIPPAKCTINNYEQAMGFADFIKVTPDYLIEWMDGKHLDGFSMIKIQEDYKNGAA